MIDEKEERKIEGTKPEDNEFVSEFAEKTSLGGAFNTGVTSEDPEEKEEIEKKGALAQLKPRDEEKQ